jgi:hypothetical protein
VELKALEHKFPKASLPKIDSNKLKASLKSRRKSKSEAEK